MIYYLNWFIFCHRAVFNVLFIPVHDEFLFYKKFQSMIDVFAQHFLSSFHLSFLFSKFDDSCWKRGCLLSHMGKFSLHDHTFGMRVGKTKLFVTISFNIVFISYSNEIYFWGHWKKKHRYLYLSITSQLCLKNKLKNFYYQWSKLTKGQNDHSY